MSMIDAAKMPTATAIFNKLSVLMLVDMFCNTSLIPPRLATPSLKLPRTPVNPPTKSPTVSVKSPSFLTPAISVPIKPTLRTSLRSTVPISFLKKPTILSTVGPNAFARLPTPSTILTKKSLNDCARFHTNLTAPPIMSPIALIPSLKPLPAFRPASN